MHEQTDKPSKLSVWRSIDGIPTWFFALRIFAIVVMILAAYWCGQKGNLFFYQGF